jgi:hypothetical protein
MRRDDAMALKGIALLALLLLSAEPVLIRMLN